LKIYVEQTIFSMSQRYLGFQTEEQYSSIGLTKTVKALCLILIQVALGTEYSSSVLCNIVVCVLTLAYVFVEQVLVNR